MGLVFDGGELLHGGLHRLHRSLEVAGSFPVADLLTRGGGHFNHRLLPGLDDRAVVEDLGRVVLREALEIPGRVQDFLLLLDELLALVPALLAFLALLLLLLALSAGSYLYVVSKTATSDAWVVNSVASTPIWNSLLGAFGMPVLIAYLFSKFHNPEHRTLALGLTAVLAFVFISIQIRHLWEGTIDYANPPTSPGELYTYSAVWMVIAVAAILGGTWRFGSQAYRAGMLLLAIVIAKLFLIDMSDLEGLLRVASFLGLGLSLLGVSYLYQRLQARSQ